MFTFYSLSKLDLKPRPVGARLLPRDCVSAAEQGGALGNLGRAGGREWGDEPLGVETFLETLRSVGPLPYRNRLESAGSPESLGSFLVFLYHN